MTLIAESHVEEAALGWLAELGYTVLHGPGIAPDGVSSERLHHGEVILRGRLRDALVRLNPGLPPEALAQAEAAVLRADSPLLVEENRRLHRALVEGVAVEVRRADGTLGGEQVRLLDLDRPEANDWLAVNQFAVVEAGHSRRADVVVFVNGLPLAVLELKSPGDEDATLDGAFQQLQTYKAEIASLFRTNLALVVSDGIAARIGSLTADRERFMPWRAMDGGEAAPKAQPELQTLLQGAFRPEMLLALLRDFVVFMAGESGPAKVLAGYHQVHAVRRAVECTITATRPEGDRRAGVIWHTQGSGKSLLMAFYAGFIAKHAAMENPTLVVLTDRNDLDDQLFGTFAACRDLLRQTPEQATNRADLRARLTRVSGGVVFTTLQKFVPEDGAPDHMLLTDRRNVVVIADEAHRSQYGLGARMDRREGAISYGFAKYLRDALPNASFIGFTGTPVEAADRSTSAVFGDVIDTYDISRAVADGATVPIFYESRLARIGLDEAQRALLDDEVDEITEEEAEAEQERLKRRWASVEALVGSPARLRMIAEDLVAHFEARIAGLDGKAMVVCMSRRICVALYDEIVRLRPAWHSDDDMAGAIKVVMTGAATDPLEWQRHIGAPALKRRQDLAKRLKNPADPLRIVLVRDMWLTGFDAPCLHTLYVDKPMRGHGLMQAIARVNRVFRDKPSGLVVDYIGIAQRLKDALSVYSPSDQGQVGIDEQEAVRALAERLDVVRGMFRPAPGLPSGFDYTPALAPTAPPATRLAALAGAMDWVLRVQQADAARAANPEERKQALRRFADAVAGLSKAFALAAATPEGQAAREEVGFLQTVRAALAKDAGDAETGRRSSAAREMAIQQIVSRAVVSTEIVDVLRAAGMERPDISVLSEEFLSEIREMPRRNLAVEALRKLLSGDIRARSKSNVTQARLFSERLEEAIARYHANAITTAEVLDELIALARDVREKRERGEEHGMSPEEVAFFDALAAHGSAREAMGDPKLRVIAFELVASVRSNITVDWMHRETARARMRVLVKRILRKYGYPPDLQDAAVQNVLRQAEALSAAWAG